MFNAQETLCSWGIHHHNKEIVFRSGDTDFYFTINICPHCKCPSKKTMKMIFGTQAIVNLGMLLEVKIFLANVISGHSYGENKYCYQNRTARELLEKLGVGG